MVEPRPTLALDQNTAPRQKIVPRHSIARRAIVPRIVLGIVAVLPALRPADAPWVNDEPLMMDLALRYNRTASNLYGVRLPFTPCPFGLQGTRGIRYGPLPIWLDQLFLCFTHNVPLMIALRAILFAGVVALALDWLARSLDLSPWFAVVTMLSPLLLLYARALWDSTWCIPLAGLLLAAYADFLKRGKTSSLLIAIICCGLLPTVHLMGAPLAIIVVAHLLIFRRDVLWKNKWPVIIAMAVVGFALWPYVYFLFSHLKPAAPTDQSAWRGFVFPLLGGTFGTVNVAGSLPDWRESLPAWAGAMVVMAQWISQAVHPLVWAGIGMATVLIWQIARSPRAMIVSEHLCLISLAVWLTQSLLDGLGRVYSTWHYYSGTWCVYLFFAWLAAEWLRKNLRRAIFAPMLAAYAASLMIGIAVLGTLIARNAGARYTNFGTTIGEQIGAVEELRLYSDDSVVHIQLPQWEKFPWAWQVLMQLYPPAEASRPRRNLLVRYRNNPPDAHLRVETLPQLKGD